MVAHARQVLGLTADLARWADRLQQGRSGRVRLGMIDAAAVVHFPDHLQAFRAAHPDIELLIRVAPSATLLKLLEAGHLDLAVCVMPPRPLPGVTVQPLRTEALSVYGPPGRRIGAPASWGPWVLYPAGSHTRAVVVAELRRLGAPLDVDCREPPAGGPARDGAARCGLVGAAERAGRGRAARARTGSAHRDPPTGDGDAASAVRDPAVSSSCATLAFPSAPNRRSTVS